MRKTPVSILLIVAFSTACGTLFREGKRGFFFLKFEFSKTDVTITLDRAFVERYKDRATIDVTYAIDRVSRRAHPTYLDGDLHVAGRAEEIGLPMVAEVANAKSEPEAVEFVHRAAGGDPVRLTGVWRIWIEHFGHAEETQGEDVEPFERTNPPHVFEVHPVTRIDGLDLTRTLKPVPGFRPEPGAVVIRSLRSARCRIVPGDRTIELSTRRKEFNEAEFVMEADPVEKQVAPDGFFLRADVLDDRNERLASGVRMVFVDGTAPARAAKELPPGGRLHVFAIPRIDFSEIASRVRRAETDPSALEGPLPYEMIVLGVYPTR